MEANPPAAQASSEPAPYAGLLPWIALGLAVIGSLQILGAVLAGLTVRLDARLGTAYKVGTSLLTSLDAFPVGLVFVAAAALIAVAGAAPRASGERTRVAAVASLALGITAGFSFVLLFLPVLAALARLEAIELAGQTVTSTIRWVLATFVVRHSGTALVAFIASIVMIRSRLDLGPVQSPPPPADAEGATGEG